MICPSCHETLRLPKSPDEPEPLIALAELPPVTTATLPSQTIYDTDNGKSAMRTLLATRDGQTKLVLALLIPVAVIAAGLLFFPSEKEVPSASSAADSAESPPEPGNPLVSVQATKPPPPPVAVSEKSQAPDITPVVPVAPPPMPEIAASEPVLEPAVTSPIPEPAPEPEVAVVTPAAPEVSLPPALPEVKPAVDPEKELVAAIPNAPMPVVEEPAVPDAPMPAVARSHTVVRGDTLSRIARKYQVDAREIMKANGMKNDVVRLGRKLVIPPR